MKVIISIICIVILSFMFGYYFCKLSRKKLQYAGQFVIDMSDPMKDIFRLDLEVSIEEVYASDEILLRVVKPTNL